MDVQDQCSNGTAKRSTSSKCVFTEDLTYLSNTARHTFLVVYILTTIVSVVGNVAVLCSIRKRKFRFLQKTCIVFLAFSDFTSTFSIALNNIETFSQPEIVWNLGKFLCSFIPMCQMASVLASSIALIFIAMDRYWNVVKALGKRWDPAPTTCICTCFVTTIFCFVISFPMCTFFEMMNVTVFKVDYVHETFIAYNTHLCISFKKAEMRTYYITMAILAFFPLTIIFAWFYYNIATLVWRHRKPPGLKPSALENSSSQSRSSHVATLKVVPPSRYDVKVERKIRTFKIVVTLAVVFIVLRLPYFVIFLMKLSLSEEQGEWIWILNYFSIALHILNCGLDPFLYTFLNQFLNFWFQLKKNVKSYFFDVCCFCVSRSEFDEFAHENPFIVSTDKRVQFQKQVDKF